MGIHVTIMDALKLMVVVCLFPLHTTKIHEDQGSIRYD